MIDFDLQWVLVAMPLAFALGWLASRFDLRQVKREARDAPRAYFKGLNLLLNEQQDKAIDVFIEAVQNDPDTAELHFALGNLFRRRGEFERAVRVHEHLLQRGDLKPAERHRAQHALAQDFMKAGLFDRAETAYLALEGTAFASDARLALLSLYERSRDWARAVDIAHKLQAEGAGSFAARLAHYECERALEADARGDSAEAVAALTRARQAAPTAPRPLLQMGQRHLAAGDPAAALASWDELRALHPLTFLLVAQAYAQAATAAARQDSARLALQEQLRALPAMELLQALQKLDAADGREGVTALRQHLQQHPTLTAAQALLAQPPAHWGDDGLQAIRHAVDRAARPLQRYRCAACGFEAQHYFWQCPGCLAWDSYPPQHIDAL